MRPTASTTLPSSAPSTPKRSSHASDITGSLPWICWSPPFADGLGLGILHYDHDYDLIAEKTDLAYESRWLAARTL